MLSRGEASGRVWNNRDLLATRFFTAVQNDIFLEADC